MASRRTAICLIAMGISAIASIGSASALDYPTRPVRFVVGYPPGGATDIIARLVGQRLSEKLGQQFVVENKPGAGNNIATEAVVNAEPDGYTTSAGQPCQRHQRVALCQAQFRFHPRHRAGRRPRPGAERDGRSAGFPGEDRGGIHRLCQGQSRQGQHGVVRKRHIDPSVRRVVQGDDRRRHAARAVSRLGACGHRSPERPGAGDVRQHAVVHFACQVRRAAGIGGDDGDASPPSFRTCRPSPRP